MGALARALKAKYRTPREALKALGLDETLLDVEKLAFDAKRARDGGVMEEIMREHPGAERYWDKGPKADAMADLGDEEDKPDEREKRREFMKRAAGMLAKHGGVAYGREGGLGEDEIRSVLSRLSMPKNALAGGMGGELAEDIDFAMADLAGMGGTGLSSNEPKVEDRKRQARDARDRARARRRFGLDRLEGRPSDMCNYGDQAQPKLAMDEEIAAGNADSFNSFFPGAARIRTNAV
jgi:hypothetical protein